MKARLLLFVPAWLALSPLPSIVSAAETPGGTRPAVDNAAAAPPAATPRPPPVREVSELPPGTLSPPPDNAALIDDTWVDQTHGFIEMCLYAAVDWCDRLLGGELAPGVEGARAVVTWRNDFRYDTLQHYTFRTALRASIRLPRMTRKLRLVIAGENQGDPTAAIPVDPGTPGSNVASTTRASSAGLVYDLFRTQQMFFNIGAGVQVRADPDVYARARFQYAQPLGRDTVGRFTTTGAYHAREQFGVSGQLEFERRLSPDTMLLWANSASLAEGSNGWAWGTELSLRHALSEKSSVKVGGSVRGDTRPEFEVQNYRVYTGYRRNVLRSWLFAELEPDLNWPLRDDGSREFAWGGTLRLELLFIGKEKPKDAALSPPAAPPEPPPPPKADG
jgi:hypothetical protein